MLVLINQLGAFLMSVWKHSAHLQFRQLYKTYLMIHDGRLGIGVYRFAVKSHYKNNLFLKSSLIGKKHWKK